MIQIPLTERRRSKTKLYQVGAALGVVLTLGLAAAGTATPTVAQEKKPNIVIIWGDDIGQADISAYTLGLMGFKTPNIDRIAKEGVMFTDYYGEQSCTAGRASFITGQSGLRTGLTRVGLPGATLGLQKEDPTIAQLLKPLAMRLGSSARTISATVTSSCLRYTASTSSTAISTT
jgi:hypothetical protein